MRKRTCLITGSVGLTCLLLLLMLGCIPFPIPPQPQPPIVGRPCAYAWYTWPELPVYPDGKIGFYNFDVELTIQKEAPAGFGLFWAHQFHFKDGVNGYIGLQQGSGWAPGSGKIAIFSIWEAENAEPGSGCSCGPFTGEGEGWSCRVAYNWLPNRAYRLRIWPLGSEWVVENHEAHEYQWWGGWVMDIQTGIETYIGKILIPIPYRWKWLDSSVVWGAEYFSGVETCADAPQASALFDNPRADNGSLEPIHATVKYSAACSNSNIVLINNKGALLETGGNVLRTTPPDTLLW